MPKRVATFLLVPSVTKVTTATRTISIVSPSPSSLYLLVFNHHSTKTINCKNFTKNKFNQSITNNKKNNNSTQPPSKNHNYKLQQRPSFDYCHRKNCHNPNQKKQHLAYPRSLPTVEYSPSLLPSSQPPLSSSSQLSLQKSWLEKIINNQHQEETMILISTSKNSLSLTTSSSSSFLSLSLGTVVNNIYQLVWGILVWKASSLLAFGGPQYYQNHYHLKKQHHQRLHLQLKMGSTCPWKNNNERIKKTITTNIVPLSSSSILFLRTTDSTTETKTRRSSSTLLRSLASVSGGGSGNNELSSSSALPSTSSSSSSSSSSKLGAVPETATVLIAKNDNDGTVVVDDVSEESTITGSTTMEKTTLDDENKANGQGVEGIGFHDGVGVEIIADHDQFIRPERDPRMYRAIRLPNNLQVLLVSDQLENGRTGIEAASVHVQAGHFDDTVPGLAHFHEHMLFLGTKKYPDEDDYEEFLSQYGGFSNAYTDMEDTNYFFSVTTEATGGNNNDGATSEALTGALDRFAQFFIAPTFDRDAVDREICAIDSEYRNGKTSDSWRNFQILKSIANPKHPFSKFGCGCNETLTEKGIDHLLVELETFWKKYYQTYNLRLCIVGHSSLDSLQQTVVETFGQLPYSEGKPRRVHSNESMVPFTRENAVYGVEAFHQKEHLQRLRRIKPLTETRALKVYFKTPPMEDPVLQHSKPYSAVSHVLGHERPGSLHAVLNEEGYINSLSSGTAVDTADFSLFQISISLTPKGLQNQQKVLDLLFQWIGMVRKADHEVLSKYHEELQQISMVNFRFRENGDPSDFCSSASELMFDEKNDISRILTISADKSEYDPTIADAFLDRLKPSNCMISLINYDLDDTDGDWITEKWYGGKYQEELISLDQIEDWENSNNPDPRLRLPELNQYIPTDFSLRCNDHNVPTNDDNVDINTKHHNGIEHQSTKDVAAISNPPKVLFDNPSIRLWHKMDQFWRVPKTFIKVALLSPSIYSTPRQMTLNRIYQRMLNDDLNSYVYDASIAGCNYRVSCTPQGYRISVRGYSEKIPFLLDTLTSRMLSLIDEMTTGNPILEAKFDKAKECLLRETKNYRLDPPYEVASYNARLLIEESVWYLDNYVDVMEGVEAKRHPLTMKDCAITVKECLTGSIKCEALCMGNIDSIEANRVSTVLDERFLKNSRILSEVEVPRFRSMVLPTRDEAVRIFGPEVCESRSIPVVYQELAYTETEENNSVEIILQAGSEFELGYNGLAMLDLIAHIAYNSAFSQLRTKEQLGYIVSVHARNTAGGAWGISLVVQSSVALPEELERRCEAWLVLFRKELEDMSPASFAQEASAVIAQLRENETKLSQEVSRVWGDILNTEGLVDRLRTPEFNRLQKLAQELMTTVDENDITDKEGIRPKTPMTMKKHVIDFFDKHFKYDSPNRRTVSSRVYSHNSKAQYEESLGKPGILSTYADMRYLKQFLGTFPTVPYWRLEQQSSADGST